jgi:hypothetical protein
MSEEPAAPLRLGRREFEPTDKPSRPGDGTEISVGLIRRANLLANPEPEITPMPRGRSRRNRDFAVVLAAALVSASVLAFVFRSSPQVAGMAFLAIGMATAVCAWVIYGIMDRY